MQQKLKIRSRQDIVPLEKAILGQYYFPLQDYLGFDEKLAMLFQSLPLRLSRSSPQPEISFFLYSKACERLLIPLLLHLAESGILEKNDIKLNLVVLPGIHQLQLVPQTLEKLSSLGITPQANYLSLIRACLSPQNKGVVFCLDHRELYEFHRCGVDTADQLRKFGVKTLSIQHGGTRKDSVKGLASTVSDLIMVWGKRVERELVQDYGVDPQRIRVVGNPLHDVLNTLDPEAALTTLQKCYPQVQPQLPHKKIVVLAACLHTEYQGYGDEAQLYRQYIQHIYESLDFSKVLLLIKMHPNDQRNPNLYQQAAQEFADLDSVVVIEPEVTELSVYALLSIADLLLTRSSTVAEEALMMGKQVVAFDLFEDGPSKGYKHLEEYGVYQTVYADPKPALKTEIERMLLDRDSDHSTTIDLAAEFTYALDGQSTQRAVDEIVQRLSVR